METIIFRFHVKLGGCSSSSQSTLPLNSQPDLASIFVSKKCQVDAADAQTAGLEEGPALQVGEYFGGVTLGMGRGYPDMTQSYHLFFWYLKKATDLSGCQIEIDPNISWMHQTSLLKEQQMFVGLPKFAS